MTWFTARPAAALLVALFGWTAVSTAAPINYGDFSGESVIFIDVTETANTAGDEEPLFGAPSILGNKLDFDPAGFAASATDGNSDLTDGQLNFTLMGLGAPISFLTLSERGDYTLTGTGGAATQVSFGASLASISVLEVDGIALATPVLLSGVSASGGDNLGAGTDVLTPWSLGLGYDVDAALSLAGIDFVHGASKLEIALDNSLAAISEPLSIAFIAKKDFMLDVVTGTPFGPMVPEPASLVLLFSALGGLGWAGRRRS